MFRNGRRRELGLLYNWWLFVHLIGIIGFVGAHGVSMVTMFRLRSERDPQKVNDLLALSGSTTRAMYVSLILLLAGGIADGFIGHWWGQAWIWISLGVLVAATIVMYALAKPYYRRLRLIVKAKAGGSQVVTDEQWDSVLKSARQDAIATVGAIALLLILYMMIFKPTFTSAALTPQPGPAVGGGAEATGARISLSARDLKFDTSTLAAPANKRFAIVFQNQDPGVPHNVAIYKDTSFGSVLFRGQLVTGPTSVTYTVPALPAGTYVFHCDVHPPMTGTLIVK